MKTLCAIPALLLLTTTCAMAELVPDDILDSWRQLYGPYGGVIHTGQPVVTGTTTRYPDVIIQSSLAGEAGSFALTYIDITRLPDGSLDIGFSPMAIDSRTLTLGNTPRITSHAQYDLGSLSLHAQGQPGDILYSYTAPVVTLTQTRSGPDRPFSMTLALQDLQGRLHSQTRPDSSGAQTGQATAAMLDMRLALTPAQSRQSIVAYHGTMLEIAYDISLPPRPLAMALPDDAVFGLTLTTGQSTTTLDQKSPESTGQLTLEQADSRLTAAYAEGALRYGFTSTAPRMALANTPPRGVEFTAAARRFHIGTTYPIRKADTPLPFAFALALEDFTLGQQVWDTFDPDAILGHGPASFALSLNGTVKLLVDLFDQTAFRALGHKTYELQALSLDNLRLDFEGLGLSGDGGVTFNRQTDPATGLPAPTGRLDFTITGALDLLDKIGRLGLVEPMVIIGAKGALGLFATAGNGPDRFTSRIEFTDGGHISVNGQQVK